MSKKQPFTTVGVPAEPSPIGVVGSGGTFWQHGEEGWEATANPDLRAYETLEALREAYGPLKPVFEHPAQKEEMEPLSDFAQRHTEELRVRNEEIARLRAVLKKADDLIHTQRDSMEVERNYVRAFDKALEVRREYEDALKTVDFPDRASVGEPS
jgi:hypothetical protein